MSETNASGAAPASAEDKAAAKAAKKAAREAAKAAKKAEKAAAKEASKQPEQNGIRRPKPDTVTGKVWATFDTLSASTGKPAAIGDAIKASAGVPEATVRTQYARWRKFHGITGRAETATTSEPAAK